MAAFFLLPCASGRIMRSVRSLLLPLALLVFGTGVANAHDGYAHEAPKADDAGLTQLSSGGAALSPSCPGVPGKFCCCGTIAAVSGAAKAVIAVSGYWTLHLEPQVGASSSFNISPAPRAAPLLSPARPRAPPELS